MAEHSTRLQMRAKSGCIRGTALLSIASVLILMSGVGSVGIVPTASAARAAAASKITVIEQSPPTTLDPGRSNNGGGGAQYASLAYDPLIYLAPSGKYVPDLATSWHYVGTGNTTFVLNLRPGVRFSDGSTMTAQDVVKSIQYAHAGKTTAGSYLDNLVSVSAIGPLAVMCKFSTPQPDLQTVFDQNEMSGDIIGPAGLAKVAALGTTTDGAGPYMADPSQSVTGSSYVYVPTPHYWNHALKRYSRYTFRVIANPRAQFSALQTGQADIMAGSTTQAAAAKGAGLNIYASPSGFVALWINDYAGKLVPALGRQAVRQAIAYATDRPLLAKAIFGEYAQATDEISQPGFTGYIPGTQWTDYYHYNLAKARSLMKSAGYANGFTMTLPVMPIQSEQQTTEALAGELAQIGITIKEYPVQTFGEWVTAFISGKYPGGVLEFGTLPASIESTEIFEPTGIFNVFHNPQSQILALIAKGNAAGGAESTAVYQAAFKQWLIGGYADVLFLQDGLYFARPGVVSNFDVGLNYPGTSLGPDFAFLSQ